MFKIALFFVLGASAAAVLGIEEGEVPIFNTKPAYLVYDGFRDSNFTLSSFNRLWSNQRICAIDQIVRR